uniref:Uncharacterized protein n=1 Tax=Noccaea caerulescens TaxID=107243 RepID=A0A1J3G7Z9_NOCCA
MIQHHNQHINITKNNRNSSIHSSNNLDPEIPSPQSRTHLGFGLKGRKEDEQERTAITNSQNLTISSKNASRSSLPRNMSCKTRPAPFYFES